MQKEKVRLPEDDSYKLYKLRVTVILDRDENGNIIKDFVCSHKEGDYFEVEGENLIFPQTTSFSMYSLSALLPLLPAKERITHENDWMTTDTDIACPDPKCGAKFRIIRTGEITQKHSEVTKVPLRKI